MKRTYQSPRMYMEAFAANHAIAACELNTDVTFYCLQGPNKDTTNVITDNCARQAAFAEGVTTVINTTNRDITKNYPDCDGLLYICVREGRGGSTSSTSCWSIDEDGTLKHNSDSNHGNMYHVQVAPVKISDHSALGS